MSKDDEGESPRIVVDAKGPQGPSVSRFNDPDESFSKKYSFSIKLFVMAFLVFLGAIGVLRSSHSQNEGNLEKVQANPQELPGLAERKLIADFNLVNQLGEPKGKLSDYRGKVVLISFWASWCTPCLVELPTFADLYQQLGEKGLAILPINVDEPEVAKSFVGHFWETKKFAFPTFFDPSKAASEKFQVDSLPSNFVLDKQGKLVAQGMGANDWSSEASINMIKALLDENLNAM